MDKKVDPIPQGYHSVSPILVSRNAAVAVSFYQQAFGAEVLFRQNRPDGKLMHAALKIGDSIVMLGEECAPHEGHAEECVRSPADLKGTTVSRDLYVRDADSVYQQAIQAGGAEMMPVQEMFWGDRMGMIKDPYGHVWSIATHTENLTEEQMKERMQDFYAHQTAR